MKYEMLRAHVVERLWATAVAEQHGYSRAAFYLIMDAFEEVSKWVCAVCSTNHAVAAVQSSSLRKDSSFSAQRSPPEHNSQIEECFGLGLHRRAAERTRRRARDSG